MNILVTGGTGYVGSHTCVELINNNHNPIIVDNLSNSSMEILERIFKITGYKVKFYNEDLLNLNCLYNIFEENKIDAVIHFAGLKSVGESVNNPLKYYTNNIITTINLCLAMAKYEVKNIVFSSSATVYGKDNKSPMKENMEIKSMNPYGETKIISEKILKDLYDSDNEWGIVILRYFNPIGAHSSGLLGEAPNGIPSNLMPFITATASKKYPFLNIFGDDYPTPDGTGIRDYIHIMDLADGHLKALNYATTNKKYEIFNLGTGNGYSVLEVISEFENISGLKIPFEIVKRRSGDIAVCYADPTKAEKELKWKAKYKLSQMCLDSWNWEKRKNSDDII